MSESSLGLGDVLSRVREEVGAYQNFDAILEKVEADGYLKPCLASFEKIFEQEIAFAHRGCFNRAGKNQKRIG